MSPRPRSTRAVLVGVVAGLVATLSIAAALGAITAPSGESAQGVTTLAPPVSAAPSTSTTAEATTTSTAPPPPATTTTVPATTTMPTTTPTTTTVPTRRPGTVPGWTVGEPWGSVAGVTMFRGNPTRTYYGEGPVPEQPEILWRYPDSAMCGLSTHNREPKTWCGTGWTGQPLIWERPDGVTELVIGSYDKSVHFVDVATREPTRPRFRVGDIIKGTGSLDPDGYPLYYFGARDNKLRIVALDRDEPTELWAMDAYDDRVVWNDDWDSNPAIVDDIMYEGGENGWFYAVELNRSYDDAGRVTVDPKVLLRFPAFTDELLRTVGRNLSIENSVVVYDDRVYFANSGGRVVGLDVSSIRDGVAPVVFDFWVGDDVDATMVATPDGHLVVAVELERFNARAAEIGQLIKLDPYADDPLVWSVAVPPRGSGDGGLWATPVLGDGVVYAVTHPGDLLVVDLATGEVVFTDEVGWHAWSSPVLVDDVLVASVDCGAGGALRGYDVADPRAPQRLWQVDLGSGCIESTPIVWKGRIYVGSRDGFVYAFG